MGKLASVTVDINSVEFARMLANIFYTVWWDIVQKVVVTGILSCSNVFMRGVKLRQLVVFAFTIALVATSDSGQVDPKLTYDMVRKNPDAYKGKEVTWTGRFSSIEGSRITWIVNVDSAKTTEEAMFFVAAYSSFLDAIDAINKTQVTGTILGTSTTIVKKGDLGSFNRNTRVTVPLLKSLDGRAALVSAIQDIQSKNPEVAKIKRNLTEWVAVVRNPLTTEDVRWGIHIVRRTKIKIPSDPTRSDTPPGDTIAAQLKTTAGVKAILGRWGVTAEEAVDKIVTARLVAFVLDSGGLEKVKKSALSMPKDIDAKTTAALLGLIEVVEAIPAASYDAVKPRVAIITKLFNGNDRGLLANTPASKPSSIPKTSEIPKKVVAVELIDESPLPIMGINGLTIQQMIRVVRVDVPLNVAIWIQRPDGKKAIDTELRLTTAQYKAVTRLFKSAGKNHQLCSVGGQIWAFFPSITVPRDYDYDSEIIKIALKRLGIGLPAKVNVSVNASAGILLLCPPDAGFKYFDLDKVPGKAIN